MSGTGRADHRASPPGLARPADRLTWWLPVGVSALLGTLGWGWTYLSVEVNCADHFGCGNRGCPPCASRLRWVLAGAAGQWALVIAVVLLAILSRRRLLGPRAAALAAAALAPLAIIWYGVTTAVATSG